MLPLRLRVENCREGRHEWGSYRAGNSYGGASEGSQACTVPGCGASQSVSGFKTYEPPYWDTSTRITSDGYYKKGTK